jgi:hypothetical protein
MISIGRIKVCDWLNRPGSKIENMSSLCFIVVLKCAVAAGTADMPIRSFLELGVRLRGARLAAMDKAFDAACRAIHYEATRSVLKPIAERIVAAARTCERDSNRLQAVALAGLPRDKE